MSGKVHIILGTDDVAIKDAANAKILDLCGPAPEENESLEIIRGDSDTLSAEEILDALINTMTTPPFLTPEKIVWLKHFNKFEDAFSEPVGTGKKKKKTRLEMVADLWNEGLPAGITVVFDGTGLDRKRSFYKVAAAIGKTEPNTFTWFDKIDPKAKNFEAEVILRAGEFAEAEGIQMTRDASSFLARSTGGDLLLLKNEIKKLAAYIGGSGKVSLEDCHAVCTATKESLVWEFSSALAERDIQRAMTLIPGILLSLEQGSSSGNAELAVLSSTANEFKRLMDLKCAGAKYGFPANAGPNFFYATVEDQKAKGNNDPVFSMNPYRLFKMWENASRFADEEFADIFDALFTANRAMVTGAGEPRLVLENLVMTIGPGKAQ